MSTLPRALARIYARVPLGMQLGLERMVAACERLGHPERAFPTVHIAGTNGKGSVAAMVESIARADGKKTGLYTSPHLCRFAERVRVGGEAIDDGTLARLLDQVMDGADDLSFFEVATLVSFLAFREAAVDVAVLEVGIGGRLDATNVIPPPRAAAITRIALDHTAWLGETLPEIAREKAGIAKAGVEIALGPMPKDVRRAIDDVAQKAGASTFAIEDDPEATAFAKTAAIPLAGDYQRAHAAIAYRLGARIGASPRARADGIATVRWPGRLERIGDVLLDAAHNPDGAASLARYVRSLGASPDRTTLVFGTLADKAWTEMIDLLAPLAARRIYVPPRGRAATLPAEIAARHPGTLASTVEEALRLASTKNGDLVCVCGSIYLVGEARSVLLGLPRDPPVAL